MATGKANGVVRHVRRVAFLRDGAGMTDGQLLDRFLTERDETAFEVLMRRHGPMVLGVCRRMLADPHDAEDAFQATFLVLLRKAASIARREQLGNWLYGTAYRAALEAKAARRRTRERQVSPMPEPVAPEISRWEELRPLLDQELSRLPDRFRVPVVLCDLEGRTRKEAARQLNIPEGTLSGRLTTARRRLARRLTRQGVALSGAGLAAVLSHSPVSARIPVSSMLTSLEAVTRIAANPAVGAGLVSVKVAALTEGVMKTMLLTKLKALTMAVAAVSLLGGGGTVLAYHALGSEQAVRQADRAAVAVSADEPTKSDKKARDEPARSEEKTYGFLGVMLAPDDEGKQVLIHDVFADSPAAKAGVKASDVLLKVGDKEVEDPNAAVEILRATKPGDKVTIVIKHKDKKRSLTITLGKWPAMPKGTEKSKEEDV